MTKRCPRCSGPMKVTLYPQGKLVECQNFCAYLMAWQAGPKLVYRRGK